MKHAHGLLLQAARNPPSLPELDQMGGHLEGKGRDDQLAIAGPASGAGMDELEAWGTSAEPAAGGAAGLTGLQVPPFARIQRAFDVVREGDPPTANGMPKSLVPDRAAMIFGQVCEQYWSLGPAERSEFPIARAMRQAAQTVSSKALTIKQGAPEQYGPAVRKLGMPWQTLAMQLRESGAVSVGAGGVSGLGLSASGLGRSLGMAGGGLSSQGPSGMSGAHGSSIGSSGFGVRSGCFGAAYHSRSVTRRLSLSCFLAAGGVRRLQQIKSDEVQRILKRERLGAEGLRLANRVREFVVRKMPLAGSGAAGDGLAASVVFRGAPLWR